GERHAGLLRPLALLDVQVGPAQPGRPDPHDHVQRPEDLRVVDLLDLQRLVVLVQARCLHTASPYRTFNRSRHMPPLVSSDSAVNADMRRNRMSSRDTGVPSPDTNAGASSDASIPSAARSARTRSASGPLSSPSVRAGESSRCDWRASSALRWKSARNASSGPSLSPGNASSNPPPPATPPLISSPLNWSSTPILARPPPPTPP